MMKFTMKAKELKTMMEKGGTAINKKSILDNLTKLYFQVEADGTVKLLGTDMEHFIEIKSDNAWSTMPGILGIDINDIKVLSKMNGDITLEDISVGTEHKINIQCGKKNVTIPKYENIDIFLPSMDSTESHILTMSESWLLETITNLYAYTSDSEKKILLQVYNFNISHKRVEASDGYRIGMRTLENQKIVTENNNPFETVKLHRKCLPVFKKIMDKKSVSDVRVYQDKKYVKIEGCDFTYIIRRIDGEYFNVEKVIDIVENYRFTPNRESILETMKYGADLAKADGSDKTSIVLHSEKGNLYSYINTTKYEAFDELETKGNNMSEDLYIGFNPQFLADAFNIVDSDNPVCIGNAEKSPILITGNEYSFLVLPMRLMEKDYIAKFAEYIRRGRAA